MKPKLQILIWIVGVPVAVLVGLALGHALLTATDTVTVARFSKVYHRKEPHTGSPRWLGIPVLKIPMDAWIFQEIITETRPDVIVETGTYKGGSALYFASIFDLLGSGRVITVDTERWPHSPRHRRITYLVGSSTSPDILSQIGSLIQPGERVMVTLDSDHRKRHVFEELSAYSKLVTVGNYLIVEDTFLTWKDWQTDYGEGPKEAVEEFLRLNKSFIPDSKRERFLLTRNPGGYLRRVK